MGLFAFPSAKKDDGTRTIKLPKNQSVRLFETRTSDEPSL